MLCKNCPKRENCSEICSMLASKLPSMQDGSFEQFLTVTHQSLQDVYEKMQTTKLLLSYRKILKGTEYEIFCAYYLESKPATEIAKDFNITPDKVSAYLKKAYKKIRQHIFLKHYQNQSSQKFIDND